MSPRLPLQPLQLFPDSRANLRGQGAISKAKYTAQKDDPAQREVRIKTALDALNDPHDHRSFRTLGKDSPRVLWSTARMEQNPRTRLTRRINTCRRRRREGWRRSFEASNSFTGTSLLPSSQPSLIVLDFSGSLMRFLLEVTGPIASNVGGRGRSVWGSGPWKTSIDTLRSTLQPSSPFWRM